MMEISNNIASHFAAQYGKNQSNTKATAAQAAAQTLPEQANVAATAKADNSNFTPTDAAQKEATKWETFASNELDSIKGVMRDYNYYSTRTDSYWAEMEEIHGAEFVAFSKESNAKFIANMDDRLAYHEKHLTDNGFKVTGTLAQLNDLGNYEFGDFTISKKGIGFDLLFTGADDRKIEYTQGHLSHGNNRHIPKIDNHLQALLFEEEHS